MTQVTDKLLDQMVQAIVTEVDPEQVILFGSRALAAMRGTIRMSIWWWWRPSRLGRREVAAERLVRLYHVTRWNFPCSTGYPRLFSHDDVAYWRDSLNHVLGAGTAGREGAL